MLFLISKKQKDKILDDYYSNFVKIIIIGVTVLFIIFLISLFPSYLTMKVDRKILNDKIQPLQNEIDAYRSKIEQKDSKSINNSISILNLDIKKDTINIYQEIKTIYQEIPNIKIVSINVDSLSKTVIVVANIDNKNTANILVDKLNSSRYKGANLPYSVFSQNKNFIFSQTLKYE